MNGKMLLKTSPCPQLQVGEIGTRGCLMMTALKQAIGIAFTLPIVWNYPWLKHQKMRTFLLQPVIFGRMVPMPFFLAMGQCLPLWPMYT
jgi:hypothetical protein